MILSMMEDVEGINQSHTILTVGDIQLFHQNAGNDGNIRHGLPMILSQSNPGNNTAPIWSMSIVTMAMSLSRLAVDFDIVDSLKYDNYIIPLGNGGKV